MRNDHLSALPIMVPAHRGAEAESVGIGDLGARMEREMERGTPRPEAWRESRDATTEWSLQNRVGERERGPGRLAAQHLSYRGGYGGPRIHRAVRYEDESPDQPQYTEPARPIRDELQVLPETMEGLGMDPTPTAPYYERRRQLGPLRPARPLSPSPPPTIRPGRRPAVTPPGQESRRALSSSPPSPAAADLHCPRIQSLSPRENGSTCPESTGVGNPELGNKG